MRRRPPSLLGIDFGTTHTVAAAVDRGNYPVLSFETGDYVPSILAAHRRTGEVRYGTAAAQVAGEPSWDVLRSVKRLLADAGPDRAVELGGRSYLLFDLLTGYLANLKDEIYRRSNAGLSRGDRIRVAVSVPANSLGGQRFFTLDSFRRAGFDVVRVLNEPSAAGFEYAHRHSRSLTAARQEVLVYDLGGGTFDASLIAMARRENEVVGSTGIARLGGDDFDEAILELVLHESGCCPQGPGERAALLEECRRSKEQTGPSTRRFVVDLEAAGHPPLVIPVEKVFEACGSLVDRTMSAMELMMSERETGEGGRWPGLAGVYAVGGASRFPTVYRRLREIFGQHRVHRSPYPFAATAIGLAIFLDETRGYTLSDRLTRNFGVWREQDGGRGISFDVIFSRGTPLPVSGGERLEASRRYRAAHNLGHFRFVECSRVEEGRPAGDLLPWGQIFFPFDPSLRGEEGLPTTKVSRLESPGVEVLEEYSCSPSGSIEVTLRVIEDGYRQSFTIAPPSGGRSRTVRVPRR